MFAVKDNKHLPTWIDRLLWLVCTAIVVGSLALYATYPDVGTPVKVLFTFFSILLLLTVAFFTKKGRIAYTFMLEASVELRKIVWPQRDEVRQVTFMVALVIASISMILWGIDTAFSALISYVAA
jgi:preprotein translocase subunit SecE